MLKLLSKYQTFLIVLLAIALALYIRRGVLFFESSDFKIYLNPWYNYILENGKFQALDDNFSNYNPPYLYLMVLMSYLLPNSPNIVAIKLISIAFDFVMAFLVYKLVRLKYPNGKNSLLAFISILFIPTVFINSSHWGQCDAIYTSFLLAFIYFSILKKDRLAFIAFGIAFAFKLQALFLAPVILILIAKRYLDWKQTFWIPAVYFVGLLPSAIAGRSWQDLWLVYLNQAATSQDLTRNAPNLYQWVPERFYSTAFIVALLGSLTLAILSLTVLAYKSRVKIDRDLLIQIALFFALIMPYTLPKMHERYFFTADIFAVVYGFYFPPLSFLPVLVISSSFLSYFPCLTGKTLIAMKALSLVLFVPIAIVTWKLYRDVDSGNRIRFSEKLPADTIL